MNGWMIILGVLFLIITIENILIWKIAHDRTGLWTRWVFDVVYRRLYKRGGWVIMIDLNFLKSINDLYGHSAGDLMIKGVANAIRQSTHLFSARWGGDEFAVLSDKIPPEEVESIINQLRIAISKTVIYACPIKGGKGEMIYGSAAIGYGHDQQSADVAMYRDKADCKNNRH